MPHTPRHIGTVAERLQRFREQKRREEGLPPVSTPVPDVVGDDSNIQDFLVARNEFRTGGDPLPADPRPPSTAGTDRLKRVARDLVLAPERGSSLDFPGGELLEFIGDSFDVADTLGRYLGSIAQQGRTPFRTERDFNEAERFFQTLPQDTQAGTSAVFDLLNFILPPVSAGAKAIKGGTAALRARNLGTIGKGTTAISPTNETFVRAFNELGDRGRRPLAKLAEAERAVRARPKGIDTRVLALRESKAPPQSLSRLEQSTVNERVLVLRESKRLEQTALPAPAETVPDPQIGTGQAGFGIGETPAQGRLVSPSAGPDPVPLIDEAELAGQAARRDEIARGQQKFPEEIIEDIPDTRIERANQALFEAEAEFEAVHVRGGARQTFASEAFRTAAARRAENAAQGIPFVRVRARQAAARVARREARAEVRAAGEELQSISVGEVIEEGGIKSLLARFRAAINHPEGAQEWEKLGGIRSGERGRRAAAGQDLLDDLIADGVSAKDALAQSGSPLSGPLPGVEISRFDEFKVSYVEEALFREIATTSKLRFFERKGAETALIRALNIGSIPRDPGAQGGSSLTLLQKVFGGELVDTLNQGLKLEDVIEAETRAGLGLTRFQGARRGDPGPIGDVLNLPQPETPRMVLGEEFPPFSGIESLAVGENARRTFLAAGRAQPTGPSQVIDAPGTQGALQSPEIPLLPESPPSPFSGREVPAEALFPSELAQNVSRTDAPPPLRDIPPETRTIVERGQDVEALRALNVVGGVSGGPPPRGRTPGTANIGDLPPDDPSAVHQIGLIPQSINERMIRWAKLAGVNAVDLGNLLRANLASFDMSYLRQQKKMLVSHPVNFARSFKSAFRALWSQDYANQVNARILAESDMPLGVFNPAGQERLYDKLGLEFLRPLDGQLAKAAQREESLIILGEKGGPSRPFAWIAQHSPWINISGRAFVTGTNSMNWSIWKGNLRNLDRIQKQIASGQITPKSGIRGQLSGNVPEGFNLEQSARSFGHMLEEMSGRARLGPLEKLSPALNAGFFSIRQRLGLLLSPRHLFNPDKFTRQEAWRNFMSSIAVGSGIVLAGEKMGLWEVETDPRSSDYMKIKIRRVRIDIWGGNQQFFVLYARLLSALATGNEAAFKATRTGRVSGLDPVQTLAQFARVGASPGVSTGIAAGFERDFGGRSIDRGDWRFWLQQNLPLAIQDIREAYEAEGLLEAGVVAPLSLLGEGIQAHELTQQDVALQLYDGRDYDDLPARQRKIVRDRLKRMRSERERAEVKKKEEESKQRVKDREAERRRDFFGGRDAAPNATQQEPSEQSFGTVEDRLRRLRESKVPVGAGR